MEKRFVSIWFRHLCTDRFSLDDNRLKGVPFVLRAASHGRMIISATNSVAEMEGIRVGMALADARAIVPALEVRDEQPNLVSRLIKDLAEWCIRFTPVVAVDPPDGLLLDATGCSHLWGGDGQYLKEIVSKLRVRGYDVRAAIADTVGVSWGIARFGQDPLVVSKDLHVQVLKNLPPEALRLEPQTVLRLHKLGLHKVSQFIGMSRASLRKRFGQQFITRLDMATGQEMEVIVPVHIPEPYSERLPCPELIVTAGGIEFALQQLLETLCLHLRQDQMGLRVATLKCYRVDGKIEGITIETHRPSHHVSHLYKLFELKISTIEPALGIELFVLEALNVETHLPQQEKMWEGSAGLEDERLSELIDRLSIKVGRQAIHRYLPSEHYWPESSMRLAAELYEKLTISWQTDKPRPLQLLPKPEPIEVTAPIPDYPPMLFRTKGKVHNIVKADGPERIEQEWWLRQGQHRDYYRVEDEEGKRYWLFRLGHYHDASYQWFLHGYFS